MPASEEKAARRKAAGRDNKAGYLFLLPWLVGLFVITIGPMIASLYLSFTEYSLIEPPQWIGLENYTRMLDDPRLHNSLKVTFIYVIVSVPLQLILALARRPAARPGHAGAAPVPLDLLPAVDAGRLGRDRAALAPDVRHRRHGQPGAAAVRYRRDHRLDLRPAVRAGHADPAAHLDVRFADGDLPGRVATDPEDVLRGRRGRRRDRAGSSSARSPCRCCPRSSSSTSCLQIIGAFQSFTQAFVVSNGTGGPSDSTMFYTLYLYQRGFGEFEMGYAAAMAWLLVVIVGALTAINFFASKYWVLLR